MTDYPLRHLSIRVPWHDAGWAGTVCTAPHLNGACVRLQRIAEQKNDQAERAIAGQSLDQLGPAAWPPCIAERATFMAPFDMIQKKGHALGYQEAFKHFQATDQRYPPYSAGIVPYRWMRLEHLEAYGSQFELGLDRAREPQLGYTPNWVSEAQNQTALLNGFAAHLREEASLCLFYAKHVPFFEGSGRMLIGVGRIKHIGSLTEFQQHTPGMRGMLWERPIQHSIRPGERDGFLMPYHALVQHAETDPACDVGRYLAHAPADHWDEFSYGSELVTHDGAIAALLSMEATLDRIEQELGIATGSQRQWLHDELVRLWQVRGPFPGLGAVLRAFGLSRGLFVAQALQAQVGENADPWPQLDSVFKDPTLLPTELRRDLKELAPVWSGLPDQRRRTLRLLSRFELTVEQAQILYEEASRTQRGWAVPDDEILRNPYRIYEVSRHDPEGVRVLTIDRGVFPEDSVRLIHPLEAPSALESAVDWRRIRAFVIAELEQAAALGHTLDFAGNLAAAVSMLPIQPACPLTTDILVGMTPRFEPEICPLTGDYGLAFQLGRYAELRTLISQQILRRISGTRHVLSCDWRALLDAQFNTTPDPILDAAERQAREEKASALAELAASRCSILAGPAGAGKTTVLGLLCAQPEIRDDGLLLLAPTGKARVRMQQLAGGTGTRAQTIAQFLNQQGRYDGRTGRYVLSDRPKASSYGTVIVDEASMLTEDMLGALIDALQGVKRLILVGDPAQLPPIGAGRPFVDLCARLRPADSETRFPRVGRGYAELTIERRQQGKDRPDLRFARWFSTAAPAPGDDDIFSAGADQHTAIRFVQWEQYEDFQQQLLAVLVDELGLAGPNDLRGFNRALGCTANGDYDNFNRGAVAAIENWQILSPLRGMPFGVGDINRQIHERFRAGFLESAIRPSRKRYIPKPFGAERIVYGDKVINLVNHRRDAYPKDRALNYLANGEIGLAGHPQHAQFLNVEFASQQGVTYGFSGRDFGEEREPRLELAYALTIHKAQGSQFKLVVLVLPEEHPILSRELIYTALTRHEERVVVMHQGPRSQLKALTGPERSEIARRRTNLITECQMLEVPQPRGSLFLQAGLIHRTSRGLAVRSKSELLIAEALSAANVPFVYEKPLTLGGQTRYPDFTIENDISGRTVYWEHLGMLERDDYRARWEEKHAWYRAQGIVDHDDPSAGEVVLLTTTDSSTSGLDMAQIRRLIQEVCGGY